MHQLGCVLDRLCAAGIESLGVFGGDLSVEAVRAAGSPWPRLCLEVSRAVTVEGHCVRKRVSGLRAFRELAAGEALSVSRVQPPQEPSGNAPRWYRTTLVRIVDITGVDEKRCDHRGASLGHDEIFDDPVLKLISHASRRLART